MGEKQHSFHGWMNKETFEFLDYFKNLREERQGLNSLLGAKEGQAYAYYIAPTENVIRINELGGIFPRNFAYGYFDLSLRSIQDMREKKVSFNNDGWIMAVKMHDCVNLFLNPINDTFFQFRRNAIIRSRGGTDYLQSVCILEIDLAQLFLTGDYQWMLVDANFASTKDDIVKNENSYTSLPWNCIYHIDKEHEKTYHKHQASELIIYSRPKKGIPAVPGSSISRILIFENDLRQESEQTRILQKIPLTLLNQAQNTKVLTDPLYNDRKFLDSLKHFVDNGLPVDAIIKVLTRLFNVENEIGLKIKDNFISEKVKSGGIHGIAHTYRVMFWVLTLAEVIKFRGNRINYLEIKTTLFAAFIHDLARINNRVDADHGRKAAQKFQDFIGKKLPPQAAAKCLNAVRVHSDREDPPQKELEWILLKDADALDRGRFSPPNTDKGCQTKYLRLKLFKNISLANDFLWAAYWLARVTKYINWVDDPGKEFVRTIMDSLYCVGKHSTHPTQEVQIAIEICSKVDDLMNLRYP